MGELAPQRSRALESMSSVLASNSGKWRGPALIVAAAVLWSTGGLGIKSLPLFPMIITGWRSLFALPVLAVFNRGSRARLSMPAMPSVVATAVAYAATLCFFVAATRLTTAANAILLQSSSPLWVILLSIVVLHEIPHRRDYLVAAGCLAGLTLFFFDKLTPEGLLGIIFGLLSACTMACFVTGLRFQGRRGRESAALASVLFGNVLCIIVCLPWMLGSYSAIQGRQWVILAALGSMQLALPYALFSAGIRHVTALRATLLALIEPILNPVWVALGSGETPGAWALVGGCFILGSLALDALIPRAGR